MGIYRNQTETLKILVIIFLLINLTTFTGCNKKTEGVNLVLIESWVKKNYSSEAKITLSRPLEVSFPEIIAYRGSINWEGNQLDGIFFLSKKDQSIQFYDVNARKLEEK